MEFQQNNFESDEFDLNGILEKFIRKKNLFLKVFFSTIFISLSYAYIKPPTWEGKFEILISDKETVTSAFSRLSSLNPGLADLVSKSQFGPRLKTEVKILESPSVLKPAFEFYKNEKIKINPKFKKLRYENWLKRNVSVDLERGTSVLILSYKDQEKDLIIPVINLISKDYQSYSGRDRTRGLSIGIDYINKQVEIYKQKSKEANARVQKFADVHGLTTATIQRQNPNQSVGFGSRLMTRGASNSNFSNLQNTRINNLNKIRNLDQQLIQVKKLPNDVNMIISKSSEIPAISESILYKSLVESNTRFNIAKINYKESDIEMIRLKKRNLTLAESLRKKLIAHFEVEKSSAVALVESTNRPEGVLLKFNEISKEARGYETSLTQLIAERNLLNLEKARANDPWELITTPTLTYKPIHPKKPLVLFLGGLLGISLGYLSILLIERNYDLIFNKKEFKKLLKCPLIATISIRKNNTEKVINLISEGNLINFKNDNLSLITLGNISERVKSDIIKNFKKSLNINVSISNTISGIENSLLENSLILVNVEDCKRQEISDLNLELELKNIKVKGFLLID